MRTGIDLEAIAAFAAERAVQTTMWKLYWYRCCRCGSDAYIDARVPVYQPDTLVCPKCDQRRACLGVVGEY